MFRKVVKTVCAICFVWFLIPVTHFVLNIGNVTGMAVFAALYMFADKNERCISWLKDQWQSIIGRCMITACSLILLAVFCTAGYLSWLMLTNVNTAEEYNGETVVVLGCEVQKNTPSRMLTERLQAAYQFLNEHPEAQCVLSGGQGAGESISEAEAMFIWLRDHGIEADRLYLEDQSTSTKENLAFSREIIQMNHLNPDLIIVTSGFHEYRAGLIADTLQLKHKAYGSHTVWWLMPTFAVREMYGILYQYVTQ